jgi:pimeloyl-ACP methyl ester carboxylesterase
VCFGERVSDSQPITERTIETNGVQLHTVEAGEPGAPVVVLAHGFPETSYSWRHQIPALAAAG